MSLSASVPYWLLAPCVAVYSCLLAWLLASFPASFSLCEVMMVSQGLALLLTDTGLQILHMARPPPLSPLPLSLFSDSSQNELVILPEMFLVDRNHALLYVEVSHVIAHVTIT